MNGQKYLSDKKFFFLKIFRKISKFRNWKNGTTLEEFSKVQTIPFPEHGKSI